MNKGFSHNLEMSGVLIYNKAKLHITVHILPTDTPETIFDLYLRHKKKWDSSTKESKNSHDLRS